MFLRSPCAFTAAVQRVLEVIRCAYVTVLECMDGHDTTFRIEYRYQSNCTADTDAA